MRLSARLVLVVIIATAYIIGAMATGGEEEKWTITEIVKRILDLEERVATLEEHTSPRAQFSREFEREGYIVLKGTTPKASTTLHFVLFYERSPWKDFLRQADFLSRDRTIYYYEDTFYFEYTSTRSPNDKPPSTIRIMLHAEGAYP